LETGFNKPGVSVGRAALAKMLCVAAPCTQGFDPVRFIDGPGANAPSGGGNPGFNLELRVRVQ